MKIVHMKRTRSEVPTINPDVSKKYKKFENNDLHTNGYEIFNYDLPSKTVINHLKKIGDGGYIIFNDKPEGGDDKRSQSFVKNQTRSINNWRRSVEKLLVERFPNLYPNDMVVLKSNKGCKKQLPHCDYEQDLTFARTPDEDVPLGCIICIEEGTTLDIWERSHRLPVLNISITDNIKPIPRTRVKLKPGQMLVFRGDLVHAGSSYTKENYRVHLFLDSPRIDRNKNRTWFMDVDYILN